MTSEGITEFGRPWLHSFLRDASTKVKSNCVLAPSEGVGNFCDLILRHNSPSIMRVCARYILMPNPRNEAFSMAGLLGELDYHRLIRLDPQLCLRQSAQTRRRGTEGRKFKQGRQCRSVNRLCKPTLAIPESFGRAAGLHPFPVKKPTSSATAKSVRKTLHLKSPPCHFPSIPEAY